MPSFVEDTHFQKTTGCAIWNDLTLALVSRSKTCSESPAAPATEALSAMTFDDGFMSAESAVIGLRVGVIGDAMSTITTEFCMRGVSSFSGSFCGFEEEGERGEESAGVRWKGTGGGEREERLEGSVSPVLLFLSISTKEISPAPRSRGCR